MTDLVALRRELHRAPEVGLQLPKTQARLLRELEGLPLEVTTGAALTSITAVLRGGAHDGNGRVVLLRADMDALPVTEQTGLDYASTNGAMHACGHDLHMAMLVGAARHLSAQRDELPGDVVFMFQPGEEGNNGAGIMIDEGILEAAGRRADQAFALHVWAAHMPPGLFTSRPGTVMSTSGTLDVTIRGKGGHGSTPHLAKDPVPAMAEMITSLQVLVTRNVDVFDPAVITVGRVAAGTARNVIPATAEFNATIRAFSRETQDRVFELIGPLLSGIASAHGVEVDIDLERDYPATVNDEASVQLARRAVRDEFGDDRWADLAHPMNASEDFSRVLEAVPGAFLLYSAVAADADPATMENNHSPLARYDDSVLVDGAHLLAELARRSLRGEA
ncbi:M20 family metallopeptidase [Luteococcus sanguinis]|uniref:M20 family metallopeptidase n=1 Tax=Luteococcus sanguinis TaxID=174038 RepID=A0ABW1X5Y3_9ACTN